MVVVFKLRDALAEVSLAENGCSFNFRDTFAGVSPIAAVVGALDGGRKVASAGVGENRKVARAGRRFVASVLCKHIASSTFKRTLGPGHRHLRVRRRRLRWRRMSCRTAQ